MQEPVGYAINNGRAEMTDFLALFLHPHLWLQFPHVVAGGLVTGSFFVVGISVYRLMRNKGDLDPFQRSLKIGLISALIGSTLVLFTGHMQMQRLFAVQPMKAAAAEAHWNTEDPAPFSIFTIGNESTRSNIFTIQVPNLLSFLVYDRPTGAIQGINELQAQYEQQYGPGDYIPSVITTYWGFRIMVGTGLLMMGAALLGLLFTARKTLTKNKLVSWGLILAISLPFLGNTAGWILTEMGRQPWLVQGLLRTSDGISPGVGTTELLISLLVFVVLYGVLAVIDAVIMARYVKRDVDSQPAKLPQPEKVSVGIY
jgi:cytochrome d ubiquinol oxidase subunit I